MDPLHRAMLAEGIVKPSIALLCPTRGRPERFGQMLDSALKTAKEKFEVLVYLDDDDSRKNEYYNYYAVFHNGPRIGLGPAYEYLSKRTSADLLMLCADDLIFRTEHWDEAVRDATPPDLKCVISFDDKGIKPEDGHPFIGRTFMEKLGSITHPELSHCHVDSWPVGIAKRARVFKRLPIVIQHMHPKNRNAADDETYRDNTLKLQAKDGKTFVASKPDMDRIASVVAR